MTNLTVKEIIENTQSELNQAIEVIKKLQAQVGTPIGEAEAVTETEMLVYDMEQSVERLSEVISAQNNYFVIVNEWAEELEQGTTILDIAHTHEEAKEKIKNHIQLEKAYAEGRGYTIFEENETLFDAGKEGEYVEHHTIVNIKPFRNKTEDIRITIKQ